jgi:glycosyltransferase involved in cell wall biosynthesis
VVTTQGGRHVLVLIWRDTGHPQGGGSELYMENIADQLCHTGHRVTIFCAGYQGAAREQTRGGVTFVRRGGRLTVYPWAALLYLAGALGLGPLSRHRLGRPDLIVDVGNGLPFLAPLYARVPVVAVVYHLMREQWSLVMGPVLGRVGWWIESWLAPRVYRRRRYVTISEATRADMVTLGIDPARIAVVYCGTPPVKGEPVQRSEQPNVVVLSRLVAHKRVELALRTFAALHAEMPTLTLTVAGQGPEEPRLRDLAQALGVADRVHFAGHVTEEGKHEVLSRAWLALTPSLKEGWGLVIVEAGARGTPTVAMAGAGGVAEAIVDGETGLLGTDEENYVAVVRELLSDDDRRQAMGVAAAKHALSFTWENSGGRFAALIDEILGHARGAEAPHR